MCRIFCYTLVALAAATCNAEEPGVAEATAPASGPVASPCDEPAIAAKSGFYFGADYLNWAARGSIWTLASVTTATNDSTRDTFLVLDSSRNSGVRAEIGYRFPSGWDVGYRFTHFDAQSSSPPYTGPYFVDGNGSFRYNVNDLEIGRTFNVDASADFRVFGGLRWALVDLDRNAYLPLGGPAAAGPVEENSSQLDAVGIGFGGLARWWIGDTGVSLFGRGALYGLAGSLHVTDTAFLTGQYQTLSTDTTQGVLDVEIGAGVGWTRGPWQFEAGYEISEWFNTFNPTSAVGGNYYGSPTPPAPQQFSLDGFYARVVFSR
jgi:hypothetical protein